MSGSTFVSRYGLPGNIVGNLNDCWFRKKLKESNFESFDAFVKWSAESGFQPYAQLRRYDPNEPHGPDNSFWYTRPDYQPVQKHDYTCKFCEGCTQGTCQTNTIGCKEWREWFVENWNKNICRKPKPKEPAKKEYFRYEHPDLVREGIVWTGS